MKKTLSLIMALVMLFGAFTALTSCSKDAELEAFTGELNAEILPIKDGAKGIITIIHDDGDYATVNYMKTQLGSMGLKASIAMVANKVVDENGKETKDADKWKAIVKEGGFDIVCHSQNHSFYGMTDEAHSGKFLHRDATDYETYDFPAGNITNMTVGAAERLRKVFKDSNQKVCTYAIPGLAYTEVYVGSQKVDFKGGRFDEAMDILANGFVACRWSGGSAVYKDGDTTVTVKNMNDLSKLNWNQLNSYSTLTTNINGVPNEENTAEAWMKYVDDAATYGGWGIFLMHQIINEEGDYQYNVSKEKAVKLFRHIGKKVDAGDIWCATFTEASLYLKELETAMAVVETSGKGISVSVYDDLEDDELYDQPVTVKVQVLDSWGDFATVKYDGEKLTVPVNKDTDGTKYVLVNVAPDKGAALINKAK